MKRENEGEHARFNQTPLITPGSRFRRGLTRDGISLIHFVQRQACCMLNDFQREDFFFLKIERLAFVGFFRVGGLRVIGSSRKDFLEKN